MGRGRSRTMQSSLTWSAVRLPLGASILTSGTLIALGRELAGCNFQDIPKLFFVLHSLAFLLKPHCEATAASLGCPFFIAVADSLPELALCAEIPHD